MPPPSLLVIRKSSLFSPFARDLPPDFFTRESRNNPLLASFFTASFSSRMRTHHFPIAERKRTRTRLGRIGNDSYASNQRGSPKVDAIYRMDSTLLLSPILLALSLSVPLFHRVFLHISLSLFLQRYVRVSTTYVRRPVRCTSFQSASLRHPVIFWRANYLGAAVAAAMVAVCSRCRLAACSGRCPSITPRLGRVAARKK